MTQIKRIRNIAVYLTLEGGLSNVTRDRVAREAGISPSLLYHYFVDMDDLRDKVMENAVADGNAELLMHGIRAGHPLALTAPPSLKEEALSLISSEVMGV